MKLIPIVLRYAVWIIFMVGGFLCLWGAILEDRSFNFAVCGFLSIITGEVMSINTRKMIDEVKNEERR